MLGYIHHKLTVSFYITPLYCQLIVCCIAPSIIESSIVTCFMLSEKGTGRHTSNNHQ